MFKVRILTVTGLLALSFSSLPAFAAISDSEAVDLLEKAKILAPSIRINARISGSEAEIATYQNPKANLNDCKIEAVLITKTLIDASPDQITRVTVYFYNTSSLSSFKAVTVTAGDIKAFGAGAFSKDELLKSLVVKEDSILDPSKRVSSYLSENRFSRPKKVNTVLRDNQIEITTVLESGVSDRLLKLEALRLSDQAMEAAPVEYKTARITFVDPSVSREDRVVLVSRSAVATVGSAINAALEPLEITTAKSPEAEGRIDIQAYELKEGLRREERAALLETLRLLNKEGVNVGKNTILDFLAIEEGASTATDVELLEKIDRLKEVLAKFESNLKTAKDIKPGTATKGGASTARVETVKSPAVYTEENADALKARILVNPAAHVAAMEDRLAKRSPTKKGEDHPNFPIILKYVIDTLKENGRAPEAAIYQVRLDKLKAKSAE